MKNNNIESEKKEWKKPQLETLNIEKTKSGAHDSNQESVRGGMYKIASSQI